jgi:hypothetical protein
MKDNKNVIKLRIIFGRKRDKLLQDWEKLHNENLRHLKSSPNIVRAIKSGIMRMSSHAVYIVFCK